MSSPSFYLLAADALVAGLALAFGHLLRFGDPMSVADLTGPGILKIVFVAGVVLVSGFFCELYSREQRFKGTDLVARLAVVMMVALLVLSAVYYLIPTLKIGRGILSLSLILCGVLQYGVRRGIHAVGGLPGIAQRVLVLGVGPLAEVIEKTIRLSRGNYVLAGFVQPTMDLMTVSPDQVVGQVEEISGLVKKQRANKLVVAVTERRGVLPVKDLLICKLNGIEVLDSPSFYERLSGKLLIENIQPSWFIYSDGFRITLIKRLYKRVLDILFSLVGLLVALPLFPLVALLVRLDSPGPVLFRQTRVGEKGKDFVILKFRTMRQDAESRTGAVWATHDDPRITRLGRLLRKTRLDELPQLVNVLRGEMSFIGPRPERPEFVEKLSERIPYYSKRHFVKPGLTGWAQICYPYGASEEDALEKLRYDLYYIKNYSILFDLLIVLETIKVVLYGRGGR